jgi:DNA-binding protein H-NS
MRAEKGNGMQSKLTTDEMTRLRREEEGCLARIASIARKLAYGSQVVNRELLLRWETLLNDVQAKLIAAGEQPHRAADPNGPRMPLRVGSASVRYRDPASGATWSGRGRAPKWIAGKDRSAFVV